MANPVVVDAKPDEEGAIIEAGPKEGKKYLALSVPNYQNNLSSYLCLGSDPEWRNDVGKDPSVYGALLSGMVLGFCDDDRPRGSLQTPGQNVAPGEYVDDTGTQTNPLQANPSMTKESSDLLHTKGGWRDHSDGNRITTTYGDKVEVIRGNYKLLVLGRQSDPTAQIAGFDISGGLVSSDPNSLNYPFSSDPPLDPTQPNTAPPKYGGQQLLNTQYTWQQDSDGNWGWTMVTQTGSYYPGSPGTFSSYDRPGNGRVVSYAWVDEMYTYVGSPNPTDGAATTNPEDWVGGGSGTPLPAYTIVDRKWGETIIHEIHAMSSQSPSGTPVATMPQVTPSIALIQTSDGNMTSTTTVSGGMKVTNQYGTSGSSSEWWSIGLSMGQTVVGGAIAAGGGALSGATAGADEAGPVTGFETGVPTTDDYAWNGSAWVKSGIGTVGKLGPTVAGLVEGAASVPSPGLDHETTVYGPASIKSTTWGTKSTSDYAWLGTISTTEITGGTNSKTSIALLVNSEVQISGAMSSSIKLAPLGISSFEIAVRGVNSTVFGATGIHNDLVARVVNQAPTFVFNAVTAATNITAWAHVSTSKTHLMSMHNAISLLHLLL
ncbi:MAG TPA: hypothetical protein VGG39_10990 [Polyangiaceae bacterium]|jgi:hypothetical protein